MKMKGKGNNGGMFKGRILISVLIVSAAFISCDLFSSLSTSVKKASAAWYSVSGTYWGYRKIITIDHTKVSNSDQSNFPVLINLTSDSDLASNALDNGNDIIFTSSDETTLLPFEIEKFDGSTGQLVAWVKISTLSHSTDTVIYLYYGNGSASSSQNKTAVWSSGYLGVWHMSDSASPALDSTSNSNNGTQSGGVTFNQAGRIGDAVSMAGSQYLDVGDTLDNSLTSSSTFSFSVLFNSSSTSVDNQGVIGFGDDASRQIWLYYGTSQVLSLKSYIAGSQRSASCPGGTVVSGQWILATASYDGSNLQMSCNNVPGSGTAISGSLTSGSNNNFLGYINTYNKLVGLLDEVEISNSYRNSDWFITEYNNKMSPSTFYTLGNEIARESTPPTNPTSITALYSPGGDAIVNNSGTDATPYFEWPAASATGGAVDTADYGDPSGVAGYYSYFGTSCGDGGANPQTSRGFLSDTGGGVHYSADTNISVPDLTTNEGRYCLRIKTADFAGNISTVSEIFLYTYDITSPTDPSFISALPSGYTGINSYSFSWPVGADTGGSGVAGYQYRRGNGTDDWSAIIADATVSSIEAYQQGTNVFSVRSVDLAGNYSSGDVQTSYYYTTEAPTKPGNLAVVPSGQSSSNSFSFSWDAPVHAYAITDYGYSVNAWPSDANITWTGSTATSLSTGPYATQQGMNEFYLVAKDEAGNYAYDGANIATISFYCESAAPPIPVMFAVSDTSDRATNRFSLTVKWSAGTDQDSSFDHYSVERSSDGAPYAEVAAVTSTAYLDPNLTEGKIYSYRVKAVDNAEKSSAYSSVLSRAPNGRFTTPPAYVDVPEAVSIKATGATITWVTDRSSTSQVRYGLVSTALDDQKGQVDSVTSHSVTLSGLLPTTKYYLQAQSLDENRDYVDELAYSETIEFTTLALPTVAGATISNVTLSSADVTWETSVATSSTIKYGATLNYDQTKEVDSGSYVSKHTYKLTGLNHSTTYHLKINGEDTDGNQFSSDDYVFETKKMPAISSIGYQQDKSGITPSVRVSWKTNVPTSSAIEYKPEDGVVLMEESASTLVTDHVLSISGLADSTSYSFILSGRDEFGNEIKSDEQRLTTDLDTRAPKVSDLQVETSNVGTGQEDQARIVVSWNTDEPATGRVEYSQGVSGDNYTQTSQDDEAQSASHLIIVSGLQSSSPYHLRVCSSDKAANETCSSDTTIIPGEVKKSILTIILQALSNTFGWMEGLVF